MTSIHESINKRPVQHLNAMAEPIKKEEFFFENVLKYCSKRKKSYPTAQKLRERGEIIALPLGIYDVKELIKFLMFQ